MFFNLIGFDQENSNALWEKLKEKSNFLPIIFNGTQIFINKDKEFELETGYVIIFKFEYGYQMKKFRSLIPKNFTFFLLETENNSFFRSKMIEILNENFKNEFRFYSKLLSIENEWKILNLFNRYTNLIISSENGLEEIEESEGYEDLPIYSSFIDVIINNKVFSIQFFNNGFNFPSRMQDDEILGFMNQSKTILI